MILTKYSDFTVEISINEHFLLFSLTFQIFSKVTFELALNHHCIHLEDAGTIDGELTKGKDHHSIISTDPCVRSMLKSALKNERLMHLEFLRLYGSD